MISARALAIGVLGFVVATSALHGQTAAHYREFQRGSDIASVTT